MVVLNPCGVAVLEAWGLPCVAGVLLYPCPVRVARLGRSGVEVGRWKSRCLSWAARLFRSWDLACRAWCRWVCLGPAWWTGFSPQQRGGALFRSWEPCQGLGLPAWDGRSAGFGVSLWVRRVWAAG